MTNPVAIPAIAWTAAATSGPAPFTGPLDHDRVQAQITAWQSELGIADWVVRYSPLEPQQGDRSTVDMDVRIRSAAVRLRHDTPASQVDRQIVHELLHVLLSGLEDVLEAAQVHTPPAFDLVARRMWDRAMEFAIERLVSLIVGEPRGEWDPASAEWQAAFPVAEAGR